MVGGPLRASNLPAVLPPKQPEVPSVVPWHKTRAALSPTRGLCGCWHSLSSPQASLLPSVTLSSALSGDPATWLCHPPPGCRVRSCHPKPCTVTSAGTCSPTSGHSGLRPMTPRDSGCEHALSSCLPALAHCVLSCTVPFLPLLCLEKYCLAVMTQPKHHLAHQCCPGVRPFPPGHLSRWITVVRWTEL